MNDKNEILKKIEEIEQKRKYAYQRHQQSYLQAGRGGHSDMAWLDREVADGVLYDSISKYDAEIKSLQDALINLDPELLRQKQERERLAAEELRNKQESMERNRQEKIRNFAILRQSIQKYKDYISVGDNHVVGLRSNGTVVSFGRNEHGQCNVSNWCDIVAVSAGGKHAAGLKANGTVVAVGSNLGVGEKYVGQCKGVK